jgi:hypothetical protein
VIRKFCNLFRPRNRLAFGRDTQPIVRRQRIQTTSPGLRVLETAQGVELALDLQTVYAVADSAASKDHPWRVNHATPGTSCQVTGGRVHTGRGPIVVGGVSGSVPSLGDHYWWVQIYYPNNSSETATAEIMDGSELPDDDYDPDSLPDGGTPCSVVTLAGWCEIIIPIAKSSAGVVTQLAFSDLYVPCGLTVVVSRVLQHYWDGDALKNVVVTETYVNGVLRQVSSPSCDAVFQTGACPES